MKHYLALLRLVTAILALTFVIELRAQNRLVNGSFEEGTAPWSVPSLHAITTNAAAISADGRVSLVIPLFETNGGPAVVSQTFSTVANQEYVLRLFYNGRGPGAVRLFVSSLELESIPLDGTAAEEGWGYARRTFVAQAGQTTLSLNVRLDQPGLISFDAIEVVPAPSLDSSPVIQFQSSELRVSEGSASTLEIRREGSLERAAFASLEYEPSAFNPAEPLTDLSLLRAFSGIPAFNPRRIGVYFAPGETICRIDVSAARDFMREEEERGGLRLVATANATIGARSEMSVVIADVENKSRVLVEPPMATEENAKFISVRLDLIDGFSGSLRARTVLGGTATPELDYTPVDFIFPATNASFLVIQVPLKREGMTEEPETIILDLESLDGRSEVTPSRWILTVLDSDSVDLRVDTPNISERPDQGWIGFARNTADTVLTVDISTRDGTAKAGLDYQSTRTTVRFETGQYWTSVRIPIIDRIGFQGMRVFHVDYSNSSSPLRTSTGTVLIYDLEGPRPVPFARPKRIPAGRGIVTTRVADMNGDGRVDIIYASRVDHSVGVLLNRDGDFVPAPNVSFAEDKKPVAAVVADFNRDGRMDVATANREGNSVSVLLGDGMGSLTLLHSVPLGAQPAALACGDFNGDGYPDLVLANSEEDTMTVLLGSGTGGFSSNRKLSQGMGDRPVDVVTADFNSDGRLDLATANEASNDISVLFGDGSGNFHPAPWSPCRVADGPVALTAADLNRDGQIDVIVAAFRGVAATILYGGYGGGGGLSGASHQVGGAPRAIATADVNGDGVLDLIAANRGMEPVGPNLGVNLIHSNGELAGVESFTHLLAEDSLFSVAAADFNGDGKLDLLGASEESTNLSIFYNLRTEAGDPAQVRVIRPDVFEEHFREASIIFRRDGHLQEEQSFFIKTRPRTATPGVDYVNVERRVTFRPGEVESYLAIPLINEDDWYSGMRSFALEFSDPSPTLALPEETSITIRDTDNPVTIGYTNPFAGLSEGAGNAVLTIARAGALESDRVIKVGYEIKSGDEPSAVSGVDFVATRGVLEFGKGVTERSIVLPILNNDQIDGERNIQLVITNIENFANGPNSQQIRILDDERSYLEHSLPWSRFGARGFYQLTVPIGSRIFSLAELSEQFAVVAVKQDGMVDETYGQRGQAILPTGTPAYFRALPGGRLGVEIASNGNSQIVVLDSHGKIDTEFKLEPFLNSKVYGPTADGKYLSVNSTVKRLMPDGSVDGSYKAFETNWRDWGDPLGMDGEGRLYFRPSVRTFNGVKIGALGRLTPDGELDSAYRPLPGDHDVVAACVRSDSSALAAILTTGDLYRISPEGVITLVASNLYDVRSVELLENDWIYIRGGWCAWGHCDLWALFITPDGRRLDAPNVDSSGQPGVSFSGNRYFKSEPGVISLGRLTDRPSVGWVQAQAFAANSDPGIELERSGVTTSSLAVICRLKPTVSKNELVESFTRIVQFEPNHSRARLDLSFLRSDTRADIRQFDISIVEAPGLEVEFPKARVIIVPNPPKSGLAIHRIEREGFTPLGVLAVDSSFPGDAALQSSENVSWDGIAAKPIATSNGRPLFQEIWLDLDASFFRVGRWSFR